MTAPTHIRHRALLALATLLLLASTLAAAALITQHQRTLRGQATTLPAHTLAPRPANPLGINADLLAYTPAERAAALADIASAGFGWVRTPVPATTDPADLAPLLADLDTHNLRLIAVITASAPITAPPDPLTVATFASDLATRYPGRIAAYQIWDEPNLASGWGANADPGAYARLLQACADAIRTADPTATVLLAGLAPTTETGPANLSDIAYLRDLYALGAADYFDAAAAKPYGFDPGPDDRTVDPAVLNFSRFVALREVMTQAGGADSLLWASHTGWNSLPTDWDGLPSVWGAVTEDEQARRTLFAIERFTREWPWAGMLVLERYDTVGLAPDDPRAGFALKDTLTWSALQARANTTAAALPGNHPADTPFAEYEGDWEFSSLGADIPQDGPAVITFTFEGTDLGIIARRDNYRAYLYVTINGRPANALPRDDENSAVAVLTSGDYLPTIETIPLATNLPPGRHVATIVADRGWDQWAIVGFTVADVPRQPQFPIAITALILLAALAVAGIVYAAPRAALPDPGQWLNHLTRPLQFALTAAVAGLFWLSAWLTWGSELAQAVRRSGDNLPLLLTLLTAGAFFFSPWLLATLLSLLLLAALLYLRPEFAIALIAFSAPFYLQPRPLFERLFSVVEIVSLLGGCVLTLHLLAAWRRQRFALRWPPLTAIDYAVAAFVLTTLLSWAFAARRDVAFTEFRTMVFEPLLLYALLRALPHLGLFTERDLWRTVDFWLLGGLLVAGIGLSQYLTGQNLITAEGGVMRLRSVYGSPNNVGLYLGRLLPIAAAIALLGRHPVRRIAYGLAALILLVTIGLSFSRGAILLGVPAALVVILLFWQGRRMWIALAGLAALGLLALIPLSQNPRFAELLNRGTGPTFFRLNLWRSSLQMVLDHPLTGVGLDNFLYEYRGRYIAPAAWQDPNLSHAHNWLLDFAARLGLPGLAAALALIGLLIAASWQTTRRLRNSPPHRDRYALTVGLLASLVNFMAHGLVDASYWFIDLAFAFMLTASLLAYLRHHISDPAP